MDERIETTLAVAQAMADDSIEALNKATREG